MSSPEKAHPKKGSDVPPLKGGAESTKDLKRHKTVFSKAIVETIGKLSTKWIYHKEPIFANNLFNFLKLNLRIHCFL